MIQNLFCWPIVQFVDSTVGQLGVRSKYRKSKYQRSKEHMSKNHRVKLPHGQITRRSKWCQDISSYALSTAANSTVLNFNRLQFHPFTLSTFCNFNLRQFQPITLPPNCSQTVLIMIAFMIISKAIKRVQQLTIIFHTMKCDNYLQRFSSINSEVN